MSHKKQEKEKEEKSIAPTKILDDLDRTNNPYVLIMRDSDSVLIKKAEKSKIQYHTNMIGDALLNTLQVAANMYLAEQRKRQQPMVVGKK